MENKFLYDFLVFCITIYRWILQTLSFLSCLSAFRWTFDYGLQHVIRYTDQWSLDYRWWLCHIIVLFFSTVPIGEQKVENWDDDFDVAAHSIQHHALSLPLDNVHLIDTRDALLQSLSVITQVSLIKHGFISMDLWSL